MWEAETVEFLECLKKFLWKYKNIPIQLELHQIAFYREQDEGLLDSEEYLQDRERLIEAYCKLIEEIIKEHSCC